MADGYGELHSLLFIFRPLLVLPTLEDPVDPQPFLVLVFLPSLADPPLPSLADPRLPYLADLPLPSLADPPRPYLANPPLPSLADPPLPYLADPPLPSLADLLLQSAPLHTHLVPLKEYRANLDYLHQELQFDSKLLLLLLVLTSPFSQPQEGWIVHRFCSLVFPLIMGLAWVLPPLLSHPLKKLLHLPTQEL